MNRTSERGSAIMMLFLAVGLFAALAYAFMQGSRNSTNVITNEQAKAYAQQIIAYGNDITTGVKRLSARGCLDTQISTQNISGNFSNPNAPVDHSCDLFHKSGASLVGRVVPQEWTSVAPNNWNPWFNGQMAIQDVGTTEPELVMWINNVKPEICAAMNSMLGINSMSMESLAGLPDSYAGTYALVDTIGDAGGSPYKGKRYACWDNNYFHVLLAR